MDIRQLRYFLAIVKEEQITRAAKTLNMEQPPLSRQLKLMEEELGLKLFDRDKKQLHLTQAGSVLEKKAKSLLQQLDETMTEIKEINLGISGTLSIGSAFSCISLLPLPIQKFQVQYPHVTFKILEGDQSILSEYLQDRVIELGVTRLPFESNHDAESYSIAPLRADPFVLVLPQQWSLSKSRKSIRIKEITDLPLLSLKSDKTTKLHEKIVAECRRYGFEPKIIGECSSVAIIISLVVAGIGATILPKSVMSSFPISEIDMLDISDTSFLSEVGVVWLQNRYLSKSARHFIKLLQNIDEAPPKKNPQID